MVYFGVKLSITDMMIYNKMTIGIAANFNTISKTAQSITKIYRVAFSLNPHVLNFNANNFIPEFSSQQLKIVTPIKNHLFKIIALITSLF